MPPFTKLPRLLPPTTLSKLLLTNPSYTSPLPQIIPINATWFLPNDPQKRTGISSHSQLRIPHSRFFDIDTVKDASINLPHMLPPSKVFVEAMRNLKIRREDHLVFYDSYELGILAAPRAAWTARVMGHESVSVLNNFKIYVAEQLGPLVKGEGGLTDYEKRELSPSEEYPEDIAADLDRVISFDEVTSLARENLNLPNGQVAKDIQILDARPSFRFTGRDPEPRPGLSSGHMPGSISVPFSSLLDSNGAILSKDQLREVLEKAGVKDDGKTKVTSCGTGVTATVVDLALDEAGFGGKRRVYDGSWTEWAQKADKDLIVKDP